MKSKYINTNFRIMMLILVLAITASGCAQIREKFVRKSDEDEPVLRYKVVRSYDVKPNLDLYTKRYIYWKNWHKELLDVLSDSNHKKVMVSIEQEVSNLIDMRNMLIKEKADELQVYVVKLEEIEAKIKKERVTFGNQVRIRKILESLGRQIKLKFSYTKMKDYISDEFASSREEQ